MDGKVCVVTGANSGIGKETALALAKLGARVVMVCRNRTTAETALHEIRRAAGTDRVDLVFGDLGSQREVRRVAAELLAAYPRIDVLLNNAGFVGTKRIVTPDGLEQQFAVNHLAPFLLTKLLGDRLRASAPARVITVSSMGHHFGRIAFAHLQMERRYNGWLQYCNTKLANILFTRELARRLAASGVTANCLHPGPVASNFGSGAAPRFALRLAGLFMLSPAQGADTSIHLASSPAVAAVTGEYFVKRKIATPSRAARDDSTAARLWDASESLVAASAA